VLAESGGAVRVDAPGQPPQLWVPWDDVRADALRASGTEAWDGGEVERYDAEGLAPAPAGPVTWDDRPAGPVDGVALVRRWVRPPAGLESLRGHATVDAERARVEIVDDVSGATTRFPNWGDASELIAILDSGVVVPDTRRPVVEASQLLGQSVVAAMREAPGRRVVSAHLVALRAADANQPVELSVDPLSSGRTFSSFTVDATQAGRRCARTTLLLGVPAVDVVTHAPPLDGVPGPDDAVPYDMGVTGRDLRVVAAAYTDDPDAPVGPPSIDAWVRFRDVPADGALHAGLLAQFTGHMSIAAALRPHAGIGQREAHRTLSTAINAIAIAFHDDVRMDRWVLYRHLATVVHDGMCHSECRVHDEDGNLVASFSVDAMIRPLDRPSPDARTAL
jgi:acyl-CoA thioesterase